jgi:hypothetical protein
MRPSLEVFSENLSLDSFLAFVKENQGEIKKTAHNEVYVSFYYDEIQNDNILLGSIHCGNIIESIGEGRKLYFELEKQPKSSYLMAEILYKLNLEFSIEVECSIGLLINCKNCEFIYDRLTYKDSSINLFDIHYNCDENFISFISNILEDMGLKYDIHRNLLNTIDLKMHWFVEDCLEKNESIKIVIYDDFFNAHSLFLFIKNVSIKADICICISGLFTLGGNDFNKIFEQKTVAFF